MPWQIGSKISVSPRSGIRSPNERAAVARLVADVGAGAGAALDEARALEVAHRASDGDPGGAELADEIGFAGKAVAVLPAAAQDLALEGAIDLPMFRGFGGFRPAHDKMI